MLQFLDPVRQTLDTLLEHGTDRYGRVHSPIWMAILDIHSLSCPASPPALDEDIRVQRRGRRAPGGGNLFLDQAMLRAAQALTRCTGQSRYAEGARAYVEYYVRHFVDNQTGLWEWGPHNFVDAYADAVTFLEGHHHEVHVWMPDWRFLHECAPEETSREINAIWEWHFNHETAQFGRHPDRGAGCSFAMTGGEFIAAFAFMYQVSGDKVWLARALRAAQVHWSRRNAETSLISNQAEPEEQQFAFRFDSITSDTSISGLWCSRLLAAAQLTGEQKFLLIAMEELRAFLRYQWSDTERPWGQLRLDGSHVPGPRVPCPSGVSPEKVPYECWAPRDHLDLWPAYMAGYEYPQETAIAYVYAHRLSGAVDMLQGALRWASLYASEERSLRAAGGTYAQHYGMIISFFVELAVNTGDRQWIDIARCYATQAIDLLFTGRTFRGHPSKDFYEAADGVGFLCYGLTQLHNAIDEDTLKPAPDPFLLNL